MKAVIHVVRINPNVTEEILIDDIANFYVDDNNIGITYNDRKIERIPLRGNDGEELHEWSAFSIFGTRLGLKVDMTK
jgi:hypothetical protein